MSLQSMLLIIILNIKQHQLQHRVVSNILINIVMTVVSNDPSSQSSIALFGRRAFAKEPFGREKWSSPLSQQMSLRNRESCRKRPGQDHASSHKTLGLSSSPSSPHPDSPQSSQKIFRFLILVRNRTGTHLVCRRHHDHQPLLHTMGIEVLFPLQ